MLLSLQQDLPCFVQSFSTVSRLHTCSTTSNSRLRLAVSSFNRPILSRPSFILYSHRHALFPHFNHRFHQKWGVIAVEKSSHAESLYKQSRPIPSPTADSDIKASVKKPNSNTRPSTSEPPHSTTAPTESYSTDERRTRSERLRLLWQNPEWRASMLEKRRSKESTRRQSEKLKEMWSDPNWRDMMRQARLGRPAPNKGVSPSKATRLRMSMARLGKPKSAETRERMSVAKRIVVENDDWRKVISESRKGKTRQYFALRRELRALHRDLKLWSDSHRARYGRLPHPDTFQKYVAPMMVFRVRRYLILRETLGIESAGITVDIFSC